MAILLLIADILSVITILLCLVLKIPQILNILKLKSAKGINVYGLILELTSYTIMTCYNYTNNYSLLSYLEYPIILIQEIILIYLAVKYLDLLGQFSFVCCGLYFGITVAFLTGLFPRRMLAFLVPLCTPVSASSKVVQLTEILKTKNAESISLLTWFLSAFTNLTRVYTVYMDSADYTLLVNFTISVVLSSSVLAAAAFYRHPKKD